MRPSVTRASLRMKPIMLATALAFGMIALPAIGQEVEQPQLVGASTSASGVSFQPVQSADGWILVVTGPEGFTYRQEFWGEAPSFSLSSFRRSEMVDGSYTWEIRPSYILDESTRRRLAAARESGDAAVVAELEAQLRSSGAVPQGDTSQSGNFLVEGGRIVSGGASEQAGYTAETPTTGDQVINDDLIVTQSLCVGFDCVNGENFGFNTIILKENNLRIRFWDTSNTGSFPSNDWELEANDSSNGGQNRFSLIDVDAGRRVFVVEAGAPSNSLYVDDGGRLGVRTSTPVTSIHAVNGNTPTLRLEQDGSSGFSPQTWDIAGNETNFFIRDATNGSKLPFRIRPGAPTSSIDINGQGYVGIGTGSPTSQLHVKGNSSNTGGGNSTRIAIENTTNTLGVRDLLTLTNYGSGRVFFNNTAASANWFLTNQADSFVISKDGSGQTEFQLFNNGDLTIQGSLTENSSREFKTDIRPLDLPETLTKARGLPLYEWSYKDRMDSRHIGPMAEDFWQSFGLGSTDRGISPRDVAAVALASTQGLYDQLQQQGVATTKYRVRLETIEKERDKLIVRLASLERALRELKADGKREKR